jgi:hypothetical protein
MLIFRTSGIIPPAMLSFPVRDLKVALVFTAFRVPTSIGLFKFCRRPTLVECRNFCRLLWVLAREEFGGAEGDRTPDLMNAIHALSQLSYGPVY